MSFLPIFGIPFVDIAFNNEKNDFSVIEFDSNFDESPLSAGLSRINFNSPVNIYNAINSNITSLYTYDFNREQGTGGVGRERIDDLVIGYENGYASVIQGALISEPYDPYTTWPLVDRMDKAIENLDEKIIATIPQAFQAYKRYTADVLIITNESIYYMEFSGIREGHLAEDYYDGSYWTQTVNFVTKIGPSTPLDNQIFTCFTQTSIMPPYIDNQFVIGTESGKIVFTMPLNNGLSDPFQQIQIHSATGSAVKAVQVADINVDGSWDVVGLFANGTVKAFLGQSSTGYSNWSIQYNLAIGTNLQDFRVIDLDNNAFVDIVGYTGTGLIKFYQNRCWYASVFSSFNKNNLNQYVSDMSFADFDRDGDVDMVFALGNSSLAVLENHHHYHKSLNPSLKKTLWANEPLDERIVNGPASYKPLKIKIIDWDLNGWPDVLTSHTNGRIYGWKNNNITKSNQFSVGSPIKIIDPIDFTTGVKIAFGDIDNDGDQDLVVAFNTMAAAQIYAYLNPGSTNDTRFYSEGFFKKLLYFSAGEVQNIALIDLDNNGVLDIVYSIYGQSGNYIRALKNPYNNASGYAFKDIEFTVADEFDLLLVSPTSVKGPAHFADLINDGLTDFLIIGNSGNISAHQSAHYYSNPFSFSSYQGTGLVVASTIFTDVAFEVTGLVSADFEGLYRNTDFSVMADDIVFTDYNGSVYYLPGQVNVGDYSNTLFSADKRVLQIPNSTIDGATLSFDRYRRSPVMLVGGTKGNATIYERDTGYLSAVLKTAPNILTGWGRKELLEHNYPIFDINGLDMNQDGIQDVLFKDLLGDIYVAIGEDTILTGGINEETMAFEKKLLINQTETGILIRNKGIYTSDLDSDGDEDIIVIDGEDKIHFFRNALDDDIATNYVNMTVAPVESASFVIISVSVNDTLKNSSSTPILRIDYAGMSNYYPMSYTVIGKEYYLIYNLIGHGTYSAFVNVTDQWNNVAFESVVFHGDFLPPGLSTNIDVNGFCNGSFEIFVYNNTSPIESILHNKIGINITDVVNTQTFYFETDNVTEFDPQNVVNNTLYYREVGVWWMRVVLDDLDGTTGNTYKGFYNIGINATDKYGIFYTYIQTKIYNDEDAPSVLLIGGVTMPLELTILTLSEPILQFAFNFTEDLTYMRFWVEDKETDGTNVLYGEESYLEAVNPGDYYRTTFRANKDGD